MLWFCWRARATGEYGGLTPVDLFPGLIDISGKTNISKIIEYCNRRGPLVAPFTIYNRFGMRLSSVLAGAFGTGTGIGGFSGGGGGGGADSPIAPAAGGSSSGGGAAACACLPDVDPGPPEVDLLTVVVCTELDCSIAEPKIEITVCGGVPPYQWSTVGGEGDITAVQSGTNNRNVLVTPPDRPTVSGTAYSSGLEITNPGSCPNSAFQCSNAVGCDDVEISSCTGPTSLSAVFSVVCVTGGVCDPFVDCLPCSGACADFGLCCPFDRRSQQMKDDGCLPCALSMDGLTITVEDAVGTKVSTVIAL